MKNGENVSVIIQGPIHGQPGDPIEAQLTRRVTASARQFLPAAEVILSTWKGANADGLDYDTIIYNDDPGAVPLNDTSLKHISNNLNRQLVSTSAGLSRATCQFAIKLRTDCPFLRSVDFHPIEEGTRDPAWTILEQPVIALNIVTRHPLRLPVLFHLSDIFHAGLLTDLRTIWNIPLVEEPGFTRALASMGRPAINAFPTHDTSMRCGPEQYLMECLAQRKTPALRLNHTSDGSVEKLFLWLRVLANNFRVFTPQETGVELPERLLSKNAGAWDAIQPSHRAWLASWTQRRVPVATRVATALRFRLLQLSYRTTTPHRTFWQRALERALGATA